MIRKEKGGIFWLEFELLSEFKTLQHGVFLRHGGVSEGAFNSLNLSFGSGDLKENVEINRKKVQELMKLHYLVIPNLEHGNQVAAIGHHNITNVPICDAQVTTEKGIGLLATHADCQAAIFYDPIQNVLANVHAGWRGNVLNIYGNTVSWLKEKYACSPNNLFVAISPSLGPEDAEFIHYKTELPQEFWSYQVKPNYFNLWEISRWQLLNHGILPHHIQIAEISTLSNEHDFFSYRRACRSGRHGTVASLI